MTLGVILAAGSGSRMRPLTDTYPKPLVPLGSYGSPLAVVAASLRAAGVERIVIAKRDQRVALRGCEAVEVQDDGNMVHSLMAARGAIEDEPGDVVICYADLIVEQRLLRGLLEADLSDAVCAVCVDETWESYYRWRFDGAIGDAESLSIEDGIIVDIGRPVGDGDQLPEAQYIGLVRFSRSGFAVFSRVWDSLQRPELFMTDVLLEMSRRGSAIRAVPVTGGWLELDTTSDYEKARRVLDGRELVTFFDPSGVTCPS